MNGIINGVNHILNTGMLMSAYSGPKALVEQAAKNGNINLEVNLNQGGAMLNSTLGAAGGLLPGVGVDPTAGLAPGIGVKVNTVA